jgi:hypothetical protein
VFRVLTDSGKVLIFGLANKMSAKDLPPDVPTQETSERLIVNESVKLGFHLHQQVLEEFFEKKRKKSFVDLINQ